VNATVATASTLRDTADCGALVRAETSGKHADESKTATARAAQSVWVAVEQDMVRSFPADVIGYQPHETSVTQHTTLF